MAVELIKDGFTFDEATHTCYLGDRFVPSCTQIIGEEEVEEGGQQSQIGVGLSSYRFIKKEVLERAAANGSLVHQLTHWYDEDDFDLEDLATVPEEISNRVKGWIEFRADWKYRPQISERRVVVNYNGMLYTVQADSIGKGSFGKDGAECQAVVEKKCTADVLWSVGVQTAAQALMFKDDNITVKRYAVQLLAKPVNGKLYRLHSFEDRNDERLFCAALAITWAKLNHGVVKVR